MVLGATPEKLAGKGVVQKDTLDGVRFTLQGGAWLVIRFSGTEPLLRIYAEGEHPPPGGGTPEGWQGTVGGVGHLALCQTFCAMNC